MTRFPVSATLIVGGTYIAARAFVDGIATSVAYAFSPYYLGVISGMFMTHGEARDAGPRMLSSAERYHKDSMRVQDGRLSLGTALVGIGVLNIIVSAVRRITR